LTTHLRIIHDEHREAALAPDNPMRDVPEVVRVWTPAPGEFGFIGPDPIDELNRAAKTGLIWHQDLLAGWGQNKGFPFYSIESARAQIQSIVRAFIDAGLSAANVTLCSDWEAWSGDPIWDWGNWSAAVQDWPGPVANFGNARSHVPPMFAWPLATASCWASHGTGTDPAAFRSGILKAKPYWGRAKCKTIACVTDPAFWADSLAFAEGDQTGSNAHRMYIKASARSDFTVHWGEGKPGAAVPADYRKQQDRIIAANSGVN